MYPNNLNSKEKSNVNSLGRTGLLLHVQRDKYPFEVVFYLGHFSLN